MRSGANYLTVGDIVALHEDMMARTGNHTGGLRDRNALEAAVMRPRQAAHYEGIDLFRQAAVLAVGISQCHAFVDGNKRTAYLAAMLFLKVNGFNLRGNDYEAADLIISIAEHQDERDKYIDHLEDWIRNSAVPR
jgi:death-on-curing protein